MPNIYGGRLPEAYGTSMDGKVLQSNFKALKQAFSFGNESETTTLTKSTLSGHVLSCLAMFNDIYGEVFARRLTVGKKRKINNCCLC